MIPGLRVARRSGFVISLSRPSVMPLTLSFFFVLLCCEYVETARGEGVPGPSRAGQTGSVRPAPGVIFQPCTNITSLALSGFVPRASDVVGQQGDPVDGLATGRDRVGPVPSRHLRSACRSKRATLRIVKIFNDSWAREDDRRNGAGG